MDFIWEQHTSQSDLHRIQVRCIWAGRRAGQEGALVSGCLQARSAPTDAAAGWLEMQTAPGLRSRRRAGRPCSVACPYAPTLLPSAIPAQASPHEACEVRITVLNATSDPGGGRKVKLLGVMVAEAGRVEVIGRQVDIMA